MADETMKIGLDAADLEVGVNLTIEATKNMQAAVLNAAKTMADANATMEQQAKASKQLATAIGELSAAKKLLTDVIKDDTTARKAANDVIKTSLKLESDLQKEIKKTGDETKKTAEAEEKRAAIRAKASQLKAEKASAKAEAAEARADYASEERRERSIANQMVLEGRLKDLEAARAKGLALAGGTGITPPTGAAVNAIASFQAALNRLSATAARTNVPLKEMQALWAQLRASPANVTMTPALQGVQAAMLNVLSAAQRMKASVNDAGAAGARAGQQLLISWQGVVRLVESQIIRRGFITLAQELRNSVQQSIEFGRSIAELQTLSGDAGSKFAEWESTVRKLSESKFGKPQADVAAAAYQGLSGQVIKTAGDFDSFGTNVLKLANATGSTAGDAANILTTALNAYGLSAEDATHVSETLFSTFEKGRTRLADMTSSFGRVAVTAGQLGVSLEETSNVLNNLTGTGVKFVDATAMLNAVFQQILKPSQELNQVFEKMGLGSVETAVKIVGLSGVIKILDQEAAKGSENLAELEKNFRSIRATLALTGKDFKDIGTSMETAAQKAETYRQAQENFAAVPGAKFQQDMEKLKNFFTDDLGKAITAAIESFAEKFGSLSEIVKKAVNDIIKIGTTLKEALDLGAYITSFTGLNAAIRLINPNLVTLAAGWISLKAAMYGYNLVQDITRAKAKATEAALLEQEVALLAGQAAAKSATAANVAFSFSLEGVAAAATTAGAAIKAFVLSAPGIGILAVIAGVVIEKLITMKSAVEEFAEASQKELQARSEANARLTEQEILGMEKRRDADLENLNIRFNEYLIYTNKLIEKAKEVEKVDQDALKRTEEQLKITAKGYEDVLGRAISDTAKKAREFQKIVDDTPKTLAKLRASAEDAAERMQSKWANSSQQLTLLEGKRDRILREQQKAIQTGTAESLREAEKYGEEAIKIEEQIADKRGEAARQRYEESIREGTAYPSAISPSGQRTYEPFTYSPTRDQERLNDLLRDQLKIQEQIAAKSLELQKAQEKKLRDEQEHKEAVLLAIKEVGRAEEELFKPTGELRDRLHAEDKFKELQQRFKDAYKVVDDPALLTSLQNTERQLGQTFGSEKRKEDLIALEEFLKKKKETYEKDIREQTKYTTESAKLSNERIAKFLSEANFLKETIRFQGSKEAMPEELPTGLLMTAAKISEPARQEAFKKIEALNTQLTALGARGIPPTIEEMNKFGESIRTVEKDTDKFLRTITAAQATGFNRLFGTGEQGLAGVLTGRTPTETFAGFFVKLEQAWSKIKETSETFTNAQAKIKENAKVVEGLKDQLKDVPASMKTLDDQARSALQNTGNNIDTFLGVPLNRIGAKLQEIATTFGTLPGKVSGLAGPSPTAPTAPPPVDLSSGEPLFAEGGFVGGPRGRDIIPAWLSSGEYVMNPYSTAKFYPQLVAMNNGQQPQYFATGGIVKTANFGDIHVNVSSGADEKITARNIARELRREIRRGTVAFD